MTRDNRLDTRDHMKIALECESTVGTVAKYFANGGDGMKPATVRRIRAAAIKLGYPVPAEVTQ